MEKVLLFTANVRKRLKKKLKKHLISIFPLRFQVLLSVFDTKLAVSLSLNKKLVICVALNTQTSVEKANNAKGPAERLHWKVRDDIFTPVNTSLYKLW